MSELKTNSGQIWSSMTIVNSHVRIVTLLATCAITACGGGGGSAPAPPPGSGWQQGVFLDASTFAAQCAVPRFGTSDIQGTATDENNFLRSYSDDTYLWYDEIVDQDPALFNDPLDYFYELKTTARTSSNQPKDKFHFTFDTVEWLQLSQSGASAGYGAQFAVISGSPPRQILIAYTEPNSPATNLPLPLARGAEIISVNGEPVVNGDANILNNAIFPSGAGETNTFEVLDVGAQSTRMVTMTSEIVVSAPVQNTKVIDTPTGRIGYILFNDHIATAEQALIDAVNQLRAGPGINDLVLDLRYNGGGFLAIASQLAYMIAGAGPTAGQRFELSQYNAKHPVTNPVTGQPISPLPFFDTTLGAPFNGNGGVAGQPVPTLDLPLPRVYVLTGPGTCSASEAIMNGLRGVNVQVIQIGSTTCGKPYGFFPRDNCGTTYFTIQFRGVNAINFGDYSDGFQPSAVDDGMANVLGCLVPDDFTKPLGDVAENRLEVALAHIAGQGCIAPSAVAPATLSKLGAPLWATDGIVPKSPWQTNRILLSRP